MWGFHLAYLISADECTRFINQRNRITISIRKAESGCAIVIDSVFFNLTCAEHGAGVNVDLDVNMTNSAFQKCEAFGPAANGGGIWSDGGVCRMSRTCGGRCDCPGKGLFACFGAFSNAMQYIADSVTLGCQTQMMGACPLASENSPVSFQRSNVTGCSGEEAAVIRSEAAESGTCFFLTIVEGHGPHGMLFKNRVGSVQIVTSIFVANVATKSFFSVETEASLIKLRGCIFYRNANLGIGQSFLSTEDCVMDLAIDLGVMIDSCVAIPTLLFNASRAFAKSPSLPAPKIQAPPYRMRNR
jgi:hypothetical protein